MIQPKLNPVSEVIARRRRQTSMAIEDLLHAKGKQYQDKMAAKERRKQDQEQAQRSKSKINVVSERIVQEKYILSGETTEDRLHRPIGTVKSRVLETVEKPTFKPKISETSKEILASSGYRHMYFPADAAQTAEDQQAYQERLQAIDAMSIYQGNGSGVNGYYGGEVGEAIMVEAGEFTLDPSMRSGGARGGSHSNSSSQIAARGSDVYAVYERSKLWEQQRQRKLEQDRLAAEQRQRQQCSFRPNIASNGSSGTNANYNNYGSSGQVGSSSSGNIADRHAQWVQQREQRLQSERARQSQEEVKDCTFVPKVPLPPKSVAQKVQQRGSSLPFSSSSSAPGSKGGSVGSGSGSVHSGGNSTNNNGNERANSGRFSVPEAIMAPPPQPPVRFRMPTVSSIMSNESTPDPPLHMSSQPIPGTSRETLTTYSSPYYPQPGLTQYPPQHLSQYSAQNSTVPPYSQQQQQQQQLNSTNNASRFQRPTTWLDPDDYGDAIGPSSAGYGNGNFKNNKNVHAGTVDYGADFESLEHLAQLSLSRTAPAHLPPHQPPLQQAPQFQQQQQYSMPPTTNTGRNGWTEAQQPYYLDDLSSIQGAIDPGDML